MELRIVKKYFVTIYRSRSTSNFCTCNTWKIAIILILGNLLLLWNSAVLNYSNSELKQKLEVNVSVITGEKYDKLPVQHVCSLPKLSPGSREVYDLNLEQLQDRFLFHKPPVCIKLDGNDTKNVSFAQMEANQKTMFAIDFESNLLRLNPDSKLWDSVRCYYQLFRRKPGTHFRYEFTRNKTAINMTTGVRKLNPSAEYMYIRCMKNGSEEFMYEDAFHNVPVKPVVEQRLKNLPATRKPEYYPGVLILGMGSTSHMNFRRYMPKVHRFLLDQMNAVEFHGFNSLGDETRQNVYPLLTGISFDKYMTMTINGQNNKNKHEEIKHIAQEFGDKGYRTSYGEDCARDPIFKHDKNSPFARYPVDYDFRPFTLMLESINIRLESKKEYDACYGSRLTFQVILDSLLKTANTFANSKRNKHRPYWHFSWTSELTHDVNLYLKYGEPSLLNALKKLGDERLLNNTILILMSDHGMQFGPLRQKTIQGFYEERLPLLYIVLPETFKRKYPMAVKNLRENSHKLVTAYDLHATMKSLLNPLSLDEMSRRTVDSREKGVSLFDRISNRRTCQMIGIPSNYCLCDRRTSITTDLPIVQNLTLAVVAHINKLLETYDQCHQLTLENVSMASLLEDIENDAITSEYEISFYAKPGSGSFHASVVFNCGNGAIKVKNINRVSVYRGDGDGDGDCITVEKHRPFCHCKDEDERIGSGHGSNTDYDD